MTLWDTTERDIDDKKASTTRRLGPPRERPQYENLPGKVPLSGQKELQTPMTPVSAEALMSLQSLIIERDAHALDETSKQNLARHLQKFVNASQKSFAKGILQDDRIQFLTTINDEAKVRRSTKSLVLGKAKIMSYEDLEEARAKRAEKEAAKEAKGKGKRGRKCKSATSRGR